MRGQEYLQGDAIHNCGDGGPERSFFGFEWLAGHGFQAVQNYGAGQQWKFYYLYALERTGRLSGVRLIGQHDWYRVGADELVREQNKAAGSWQGALIESQQVLATSFAVLFLAKGRAPVLINKLSHAPAGDWNNDADDVRNLVEIVSRDWKTLLTWQIVESSNATVTELLRAPIVFINGHKAPSIAGSGAENLREYVERGGCIFAEACCGSPEFDRGFRTLMAEMFPEKESEIQPLADDHPIWRTTFQRTPGAHPLWGIRRRGRVAVVYSPADLSCYWNQANHYPDHPTVIDALEIGQNVIDYLTERKPPPDKLSQRFGGSYEGSRR